MPLKDDPIPLVVQLYDGATDQFPLATVYNPDGTIFGRKALPLIGNGLYFDDTLLMPNESFLIAQYQVFEDSGHVTPNPKYQMDSETIPLISGGGSLPTASNIVGIVQSDGCSIAPIEDTIIMGSDKTVTVRLIQDESGEPFDLTDNTLLEFRFKKADGTILSLLSTASGNPVRVVSAAAGKLLCILTSVQTALLADLIPSPFTIRVTKSSGVTAINLPTQLAVVTQDA